MNIRIFGAVLAATVVLTGCGSGSSSAPSVSTPTRSAHSSATTSATPTATASANAQSPAAARAAVTKAYVQFFSGKTAAGAKLGLVQDSAGFAKVIAQQAGSTISQSTTARVSKVTLSGADTATVRYTILLGGNPALKDQVGTAVREHGAWKVGRGTFCALLNLEQSAPPVCGSS